MHLSQHFRYFYFLKHATLEPAFALFWMAAFQASFYHENLILQKACRMNSSHEPDLSTPCDNEKQGLTYVAFLNSGYHFSFLIATTLSSAVYIKWSDAFGKKRKFILIMPTVGLNLMIVSDCLNTYFWNVPVMYSVISFELSKFLTGGQILYYFASILYITECTSTQERTMRLGILATLSYVTLPLANLTSALVMKSFGILRSNLLALVFSTMSLILCLILVKDNSSPVEKKSIKKSLNPMKLISVIQVLSKKRKHKKRLILNMLLVANMFVRFSRAGEKSVLYIYTRHRFHWHEKRFSFFSAFKNVCITIGVVLCVVVFNRCLKMHDIKIALIAAFADTIAAFSYFFVNQDWQLYIVAAFDMFHGAAYIVSKSFTTKIVDVNELANLTSISILLNLISHVNKPCYNLLFKLFMDTFPNGFFIISFVVCSSSCILFGVSYKLIKNFEALEAEEKESSVISTVDLEESPVQNVAK